uniref:Uncharacterized LOC111837794 n=1 Tax=Paramormyrops kingsleyae TaxID=1676925 RepID=A0A3B3S9N8_9TELE|nr:uncharacterized protein LOC111837794 [Paramormyrops kingsleyae]
MADLVKATKSISEAQDYRDDTKLIMQPYANWEEYLVPAPVSIAILGELVFFSSNVDFSIGQKPPTGGFKFIKYPDSFRACLMQVANSMSAAFSEAHKNMEQIRLLIGNKTAFIKVSMKVLLQDNDELVQTLLPDHQEIIATILHKCAELADQSEKKFHFVINLIEDLLLACLDAMKVYGGDLEKAESKTEVKEIDFNTIIKVLVKGLDAMGRVKEQWEKMVRFFQMISNIIKTCLSRSLTDFVKQSQKASQKHLSYNQKVMIYQQAMYSLNVASMVNMISGTYVEVSDKHLMDMVSSLGVLMVLDPSKSYFNTEHRELQDACKEAQEAIRDLVKKNNKKFDEMTKERMENIERELKPMLPPVSEEKMKEIKEITESAFKEMSQEDEDHFA